MTIHHKDYWSPNLQPDFKDTAFPNLAHGDAESAPWGRIELGVGAGAYSHPFYCHSNLIPCGYANRDEVAYMQALAKEFSHGAGFGSRMLLRLDHSPLWQVSLNVTMWLTQFYPVRNGLRSRGRFGQQVSLRAANSTAEKVRKFL